MVSTRKKRQSNKRLLSQLDDFDQDMIIVNAVSERQENAVVNMGMNDRDFTVSNSSNNTAVNENAMNVKTLERRFNKRVDREMSNIVDTVEDRIQNAILTAIENIVTPKIELAIRSTNASSGRDVTSVIANSERGERVGINASFENASENNNTLRVPSVSDETRLNIPDEVGELSVPETRFDRQPHTPHRLFEAFSDLRRKMSNRCVCKIAGLNQTPEKVRFLDVSASSVLIYSAYGYYPSGMSEYVLVLMNRVIYCTDIGKCLLTCIQMFSTL